MEPDPSAQDGIRGYVYAHDDPVDLADPSGLAAGGADSEDVAGEGDLGAPAAGGFLNGGAAGAAVAPAGAGVQVGTADLPSTAWGPTIPSGDTVDAVSAELGSEPMAMLTFEDGWQKTVPETSPLGKFIYVIFDNDTGVIMKPGQTWGSRYRLVNRFSNYAHAARKLRLTAQMRLALWEVSVGSGTELDATENRVRSLLEGMGHRLPWENDRQQRLGRPGSGIPFVGNDGRGTWTDDPQSPDHGQFRGRTSGAYYPNDPPYYPPWTPDPAK